MRRDVDKDERNRSRNKDTSARVAEKSRKPRLVTVFSDFPTPDNCRFQSKYPRKRRNKVLIEIRYEMRVIEVFQPRTCAPIVRFAAALDGIETTTQRSDTGLTGKSCYSSVVHKWVAETILESLV